ncbi:methylmalonyl-CoA mutase family protein [Nocardioides taihuensis]|uniref:Methylmalonyl-CoA mutase family protein n=1 Tax=Nocardioides taihuensis TaxID=1835606 RepID=A0ABW0BFJ2_9ACTN
MTDQGAAGLDPGPLALADAADRWTVADWEAAAAAVLRKSGRLGEDDAADLVWSKLARRTLDGIEVSPLGTPLLDEGLPLDGARPTRSGDWDNRTPVVVRGAEGAADARETALVDLDNGATSLWLELRPGTPASAVAVALDGVLLDLAPVVLDAPDDQVAAARALLELLGDTTPAPGTNLGGRGDSAVAVARLARETGTLGLVVDATTVHDRGASEVQELAWSLRTAVGHLRELEADGFTVDEAAGLVEFRYAATDEQFPTLAKLRAARRLWARVLELSGAKPVAQRQHVVTSRPMMSAYDPWVNMLRTTVAAFAAGVGGAEAVTVLPFDTPLGVPDAFGRRIARNTSSLLISESHLARVADPAGGAHVVEKLTDDLARAAWELFGRLEDGADLDELVTATVAERDRQVATRRRPLTGVTEFPHLGETLPERPADPTAPEVRRYGAAFEALRDDPVAQPVFLATMGSIASHTARATFAGNLFAAGGVAVEVAGATAGVDDVLAAYAGQPVVCLAGTDATYAEWGAPLVAALRASGARRVILAGKPRDLEVDDSCAMGVDALAFLTRTREALR